MNAVPVVLIVTANVPTGQEWARGLNAQGYATLPLSDIESLLGRLEKQRPSGIVLDGALPKADESGLYRRIRELAGNVALVLVSNQTQLPEHVERACADLYMTCLTQPLVFEELQESLNRKIGADTASQDLEEIKFGPYVFKPAQCSLTKEGKKIPLTAGDCKMLQVLARHPHRPLSRDSLALVTRGRILQPYERSLDVQLSRLRKLIEDDSRVPRYIQTVWGLGYVFVPDGGSLDRLILRTPEKETEEFPPL